MIVKSEELSTSWWTWEERVGSSDIMLGDLKELSKSVTSDTRSSKIDIRMGLKIVHHAPVAGGP